MRKKSGKRSRVGRHNAWHEKNKIIDAEWRYRPYDGKLQLHIVTNDPRIIDKGAEWSCWINWWWVLRRTAHRWIQAWAPPWCSFWFSIGYWCYVVDPLMPIPPPLMCAGGSFVNMRTFRGSLYLVPIPGKGSRYFSFMLLPAVSWKWKGEGLHVVRLNHSRSSPLWVASDGR